MGWLVSRQANRQPLPIADFCTQLWAFAFDLAPSSLTSNFYQFFIAIFHFNP
jgi:hypothetical protein